MKLQPCERARLIKSTPLFKGGDFFSFKGKQENIFNFPARHVSREGGAHSLQRGGSEEYISHLNHSGKPADLPQAGVLQRETPGPPSWLVAGFFLRAGRGRGGGGGVIYYSNEIRSSRWQKKGQSLAAESSRLSTSVISVKP